MSITRVFNLVKSKKTTPAILNNFLTTNQINWDFVCNYKNSYGENILTYSIKHNNNIDLFEFLYTNGVKLGKNFYNMTPIDLCVTYNKSSTDQKLLILDWLYSKNIQFNPFYLLTYPRWIIKWVRNRDWDINVNMQNSIGNTPLHEVCKIFHHTHPKVIYNKLNSILNSYDAFYLLLEMGANPYINNNYNHSPIDLCIKNSLINNLNILYYFGYELTKEQIEMLINIQNYYKLIKHTGWLLHNYEKINKNFDSNKLELENILINKIIEIQRETTTYSSEYNTLKKEINNRLFFDSFYKMDFFKIENNMYFE